MNNYSESGHIVIGKEHKKEKKLKDNFPAVSELTRI